MSKGTLQLDYDYVNTPRVRELRLKALEAKPSVCLERARNFTKSYKESEGMDPLMRKALALENHLKKMTIYINNGELIVGNNSSRPRASVVAPEYSSNWINREIKDEVKAPDKRPQDRHEISESEKDTLLKEVIQYWLGKTVEDRVLGKLPEELINFTIPSLSEVPTIPIAPECYLRNGIGHVVVDYSLLLEKGLKTIIEDAENKISALDLSIPENISKGIFYKSVLIEYRTISDWIMRYSVLAEELSLLTKDLERKKELLIISNNCEVISKRPPENFWQAIQLLLFSQLVLFGLEQNGPAVSPGRMDQYLYPFYKKDIDNGVIDKDGALEILKCFFIKLSEMSILWDYDNASYYSGFSMAMCVIVGGTDPNGNDATNDLSYLILEADKNTGLLQPETAVRVHSGSPLSLLFEAVDAVKLGRGKPKFFMDGAAIQMVRNTGVPIEKARDYSVVGCVELTPTGNTAAYTGAVFLNLAKCLELALNNGYCVLTGKKIGPETGNPKNFKEYSDILLAFKSQLSYVIKNTSIVMNAILQSHSELYPCPFTSSLINSCFEKGLDFTRGGADYNFIGVSGVGIPNVANSLAAIKKYVYEDKKISIEKLIDILKDDFKQDEKIRLELWKNIPKYGNDDNYVDSIAREIGQYYCNELRQHRGPFDNKFRPGLFAVSINVPFGLLTGATAEGRKALKPLADGGISPVAGTESNGIIGVIKSATKIDNLLATNGTLLNIKLSPNIFDREEEVMKLTALLKSYNEMGGYHIQFNVINNEILRKAQKNPEEYKGLMVRVAGYSAYFIELNPEVQEDIISRTIHGT